MFRVKHWTVVALLIFLGCSEQACQAQLLHDAYALAETKADLPVDWELKPESIASTRGNSVNQSEHSWMGRRENPLEPPSPHNVILLSARVRIVVCKSPQEARANLRIWTTGNVVDPLPGAYTSKNLGDSCFRSTDSPISASLWFCRANMSCDVHVHGPVGELNYPAVVEKIARAILSRAEASLALEATGEIPILPAGQNLGMRNPRGIPVILADEWMAGTGAAWTPDWKLGAVTIKYGDHTLSLNVGSRDARLDGKPITLAFPALRHGKESIWCPTAVLSKLTD